ncbi:putative methyltransferase At1g22800, mitochondrial [Vigna radiata var. radiata]|uniref:Methyltransferase At1g22800, mitochondrial n=1 Tax=Vigna radiata var. radiata TaxID=3916 RepID=A0A1S3TYN9_VIGRR|nr:putative methyltransferase At1g22800, mitochondrial [Vigna radiata var. radiata]
MRAVSLWRKQPLPLACRSRTFVSDSTSKVQIFDRQRKRAQRDRAAWSTPLHDPLLHSVSQNLLDRLQDCKKTFPTALCLGGSLQSISRSLSAPPANGGVEKLIVMDASYDMIQACRNSHRDSSNDAVQTEFLVADEEFLPIKESSVDLVVSCLGLHWTNDLPGAMIQSRLALKPDGLFLAAILGGETLKELRIACTLAQMEREGGISPRISPLAQVRDAGNLLTRAGFTLPGVDVDEYIVKYESALELIEHLRAMGETNALSQMNNILKRDTALATAAIYDSMFSSEDGTVPATFQVIYMTGWREHPSQQKAKRRGSATISFNDIQKQFGSQS